MGGVSNAATHFEMAGLETAGARLNFGDRHFARQPVPVTVAHQHAQTLGDGAIGSADQPVFDFNRTFDKHPRTFTM